MAKSRKKKGPSPRKSFNSKPKKWTAQQIGILIFSILIILSMTLGLMFSALSS